MRLFIPLAIIALALAACDKDREEEGSRNAGAGMTADAIVANDVTAIDAVTADAANMAADINYAEALDELNSGDSNAAGGDRARSSSRPTRSATRPTRATGPAETPPEPATDAQ